MMKKSFNIWTIVLLVFFLGLFLPEVIESSIASNYQSVEETFEIISELFSVFVALSIFGVTWHAYNKSRDNHSLFLGTAFLISGILILCHLLSYPFMPDFITLNTHHKAGIFFLESRFILAFFLLASVFVNKDSFPKLINKNVMVSFSLALLSVSMVLVLFYHDFLFKGVNIESYSPETVFLLFLITIMILVSGYLYNKMAKETSQINLNYLANGSIIVLISNLVYFQYEFSGHFLIITGFFYFYLGLYKSSVELPYERLAISEEKLRLAAQEKYRQLFDNANDAIVTIDTDGRVTSWNKSAQKLFSWTFEEMTGKKLVETVATPGTAADKEKMMCALLSDIVTGQEMTCQRRDGTKLDVSVTISPLLDINRNVVERSLIIRDISAQKKYENELRKSEEFSRTILNSMNDGIMVIDACDFSIVRVNSFLLKKFGLIEEEVIGKKCFEISHKITEPCFRKNEICPVLESVDTGKYSIVEHVHFGKNGEKIYAEVSTSPIKDDTGRIVQIIHVTRDITERKETERALYESERRFRETLENIRLVAVNLDSQGNIIFCNDYLLSLTGWQREEVMGKNWFEMFVHSNLQVKKIFLDGIQKGKVQPYFENDIITRTGDKRLITWNNTILRDPQGMVIGTASIGEDITDHKLAEEKVRKSLEEKEVLLREIHHRVKNNMQVVSSLLMLQSQNIEEKKYKDIFIDSQNRIQTMALIHEKLYQSKNIAQINFKEYIDGIVSNILESYNIKSNIKMDINIENIPIGIDFAVPCGLIINELITNSLKYAFPEGRQGTIQISLKSKDNNMVQLSISDDGIGIPKDMDIRNTKSLGLLLVTSLAEGQLHGKINLNRECGTEFQIIFCTK